MRTESSSSGAGFRFLTRAGHVAGRREFPCASGRNLMSRQFDCLSVVD
jgi:hypothetical protein